jgi:hypothetical protein
MAFRRNGGYSVVQSNHKRKARVLSRRTEDESLAKRLRHLPRARVEGARLETGSGAALTQGTVYNRLNEEYPQINAHSALHSNIADFFIRHENAASARSAP